MKLVYLIVINMKQKIVTGNQSPFMTKDVSNAIMLRSKLKNKFNKCLNDENLRLYKKQRNFCVNLLNKNKRR